MTLIFFSSSSSSSLRGIEQGVRVGMTKQSVQVIADRLLHYVRNDVDFFSFFFLAVIEE